MPSQALTDRTVPVHHGVGEARGKPKALVAALGVGLPVLLGLLHVALVWPHYHVGSFDDDASYILTAKALLAGQGLTGHLASGEAIVSLYAPGFSALLTPLVWLWPHGFVALRLFSVVCFVAIFPLTWIWLGNHRVSARLRCAALVVLALGPPFATYASMVMAEAAFLVVLMLLLLAVDAWSATERLLSKWTWIVIVASSALVWIKEAGIGIVIGLILWTALRPAARRLARASLLAGCVAASLAPVIIARLMLGKPLAGSLYTMQLGVYYQGGLFSRLLQVAPHSVWHLFATAIPATIVPYLAPLPIHGHWVDVWKVLSWQVSICAGVGAYVWSKRSLGAVVPMLVVYLGESVVWPFVNERRAILVLPILVAWYVIGAAAIWRAVSRAALRARKSSTFALKVMASLSVACVVIAPLVAQMPRDYLFGWNQSSSQFSGSRYARFLSALGSPGNVVETDYKESTALFTGHRTQWTAFTVAHNLCYLPAVMSALAGDNASYMLNGDFNKPGLLDSGCINALVADGNWAVPLLHSLRDNATVYELVGPYSAHPGLVDILGSESVGPVFSATTGSASQSWYFTGTFPVSQVSVGEAWNPVGPTSSVELQLETSTGVWETVSSAKGSVGGGASGAPWLIRSFATPVEAQAIRVVVTGPSGATAPSAGVPSNVTSGASAVNVAAIGPAGAGSP